MQGAQGQEKKIEKADLDKKLQAINLNLTHEQKNNQIETAMKSIQSIPNGGGDLFTIIGQHKIHEAQSKVSFGLAKRQGK